jgi:hypothetical protein
MGKGNDGQARAGHHGIGRLAGMARPRRRRGAGRGGLASAGGLLVMLGWVLLVPLGPPPTADGGGPVVLDAPTRAGLFAQFDPFARDGAAAGAGGGLCR